VRSLGNGWKWSTSKPINFCCSNEDCPSQDNIKGICDTTGAVTQKPYTCYWPKCTQDSDCVSGTYCYCGSCSSTFTSAGCPTGQCCDKGYGGSGIGQCVKAGTIKNIGSVSYLCDPPEWNSNHESKFEKNVFESILSFFYSFFQR
jgi:hypothetical protein